MSHSEFQSTKQTVLYNPCVYIKTTSKRYYTINCAVNHSTNRYNRYPPSSADNNRLTLDMRSLRKISIFFYLEFRLPLPTIIAVLLFKDSQTANWRCNKKTASVTVYHYNLYSDSTWRRNYTLMEEKKMIDDLFMTDLHALS